MTRHKTFRLVVDALLMAIVLLQNLVPFLGYIPFGPFSMTLIGLTVIVAGSALGPRDGLLIGGFWGLITFVRAFTWPSSPVAPLIFTNPLISILPRLLMGLVAGSLYLWGCHRQWSMRQAMQVAAGCAALTNTVLVLGLVFLFYQTPAVATAFGATGNQTLGYVLMISLFTNGIPELILDVLVAPLIAMPLRRQWERLKPQTTK
ncbi:ECF transporter S component [Levilactobacillus brevis]|nr:ECF transporter S component [Levilactobacillus brevis]MDM5045887.1 ECF transporter S component [Levilactobacillus brevis]PUD95739.1 ECF transporter S component [Levilactobacillus brevis]ULH74987.1 ECF transporter S component [Levilactobacillus brevis]WAE45649.1 ECF transporter S component [Levilactobacillus brevis]